jgi:molybdopterin synthase sulfur carrier subunit
MTTVRYWAGLKAAAGVAEEQVEATTLSEALALVRARHNARFSQVLACCSVLVDGAATGSRDPAGIALRDSLVDCLPPFAGG